MGRLKEAVDSEQNSLARCNNILMIYQSGSIPRRRSHCAATRRETHASNATERANAMAKAPLHCTEKVDAFMTCAAAVQKEFVRKGDARRLSTLPQRKKK